MSALKKFSDPFDETEMFTVGFEYIDISFREKWDSAVKI